MFDEPSLRPFLPPNLDDNSISTAFTTSSAGPGTTAAMLRSDRPALVVSATSWTADEDFEVLLRALSLYDATAAASSSGGASRRLPKVVVVITGKGGGRAAFERRVVELEKVWEWVRVRTAWLAIEDYPLLLGECGA